MLGIRCPCSLHALQIRCYSQGGGARPAHILGTEMVLVRTFSRQEVGNWFLAAGTRDTIACVADEPDAEILFSSLEKSTIILIITIILIANIILIINYF